MRTKQVSHTDAGAQTEEVRPFTDKQIALVQNFAAQAVIAIENSLASSTRCDLSKIEAGKLELNPQTVQLAPLINEVIGTAGQLAEKNKNRLVVDAQENLGVLTVDPMRLRQILLNLLSNACK